MEALEHIENNIFGPKIQDRHITGSSNQCKTKKKRVPVRRIFQQKSTVCNDAMIEKWKDAS